MNDGELLVTSRRVSLVAVGDARQLCPTLLEKLVHHVTSLSYGRVVLVEQLAVDENPSGVSGELST